MERILSHQQSTPAGPAVQPVVVYGASGFAREVYQLIRDLEREGSRLRCIGFLLDPGYPIPSRKDGPPVLGDAAWLNRPAPPSIAIGIGSTDARCRIVRLVSGVPGLRFVTLCHPRAYVGETVKVGAGCIINVGASATVDIDLGKHVQLHAGCTVGHDVAIGDFVTVAPGANISGGVSIGEGVFVGAGAVVLPRVELGPWSTIGAGAVVTRNVPANATVTGGPARIVDERAVGWQLSNS